MFIIIILTIDFIFNKKTIEFIYIFFSHKLLLLNIINNNLIYIRYY